MFHRLQAAGGRVLVLNIVVEHRLSLRNLEAEMGLDRYTNVPFCRMEICSRSRIGRWATYPPDAAT